MAQWAQVGEEQPPRDRRRSLRPAIGWRRTLARAIRVGGFVVLVSICGLAAVGLHRAGKAAWRGLAIVSLSLTFCAGLMAISFWAIRGDFDPTWWAVNLALMIWPLFYLQALVGPGHLNT